MISRRRIFGTLAGIAGIAAAGVNLQVAPPNGWEPLRIYVAEDWTNDSWKVVGHYRATTGELYGVGFRIPNGPDAQAEIAKAKARVAEILSGQPPRDRRHELEDVEYRDWPEVSAT